MARAGFVARFVALVLDGIVLNVIAFAIAAVWAVFAGGASVTDSSVLDILQAGVAIGAFLAILSLQFIYFGVCWSRNGQTVGMRVMDIKATRRGGQPMSFLRAALRGTIGYYISGAVFFMGFLWAAFDSRQETWHDKIFDTRVGRS